MKLQNYLEFSVQGTETNWQQCYKIFFKMKKKVEVFFVGLIDAKP